jgi:hypothetical protein
VSSVPPAPILRGALCTSRSASRLPRSTPVALARRLLSRTAFASYLSPPIAFASCLRWATLALVLPAGLAGCVHTYDLIIDNRTVTSLTLRVYSLNDDGEFSQYPDRIFSLPPNREFRLVRAIVSTGRGDRRLFEFRQPDEQLVDSFVLTYAELEASGGRITVPRSLAGIPRDAPPDPDYVDSTPHERVDFIPLFPKDSAPAGN